MAKNGKIKLTKTEQVALDLSSFDAIYRPTEKIPTIVVDYFPALGRLAAVRFLEWVQNNPGGVVSLPTGKTPEYFIKWAKHFLEGWDSKDIRKELEQAGIDPAKKPDISSLHFVQIDEFYPMDSSQANSFFHYVNNYYLKDFGFDPEKAMLIDASRIGLDESEKLSDIWPDNKVDLTLRYRQAKNAFEARQKQVLESIDQWCMEYEEKINKLGGIGFFLGGIGPDGHIGFNIAGSDHNLTTRLCPINYETQAAAATDLGGIEIARQSLVITIGLGTITRNANCTAVIIAAGDSKAGVVANAIQSSKNVNVPATALQGLANARFYITNGAALKLVERQFHKIKEIKEIDDRLANKILVDLASQKNKQLVDLTAADSRDCPFTQLVLSKRKEKLPSLTKKVRSELISRIERGMNVYEDKCFLHTEPHHDDVMLGYFAQVVRHFRRASNTHHFATLTSGFTSVTNEFMLDQLNSLSEFMQMPNFSRLIESNYFANKTDDKPIDIELEQYPDYISGFHKTNLSFLKSLSG